MCITIDFHRMQYFSYRTYNKVLFSNSQIFEKNCISNSCFLCNIYLEVTVQMITIQISLMIILTYDRIYFNTSISQSGKIPNICIFMLATQMKSNQPVIYLNFENSSKNKVFYEFWTSNVYKMLLFTCYWTNPVGISVSVIASTRQS